MNQYQLTENHFGIVTAGGNISEVFLKLGILDSAEKYSQYALSEAKAIHDLKHIQSNYELLAKIDYKKQQYKSAYDYLQLSRDYTDSVNQYNMSKKIADLDIRYGASKYEIENKMLRKMEQLQQSRFMRQRMIGITIIILLLFSITRIIVIMRSRKKLKEMHDEINEQKKKLQEEAEFRLKLFSIVSHDFRSPISTLQGYLYLLENNMMEPDELKVTTVEMNKQLQLTADFAENLLNWSASQLQGYKPEIHDIDLYEMVGKIFDLYRRQSLIKGLKLENEIIQGTVIRADHDFIRLVLRNLVSNAIKFTETGYISVRSEFRDKYVTIHVKDTGNGIPDSEVKLLFTEKTKTKEGTSNEKGAGLGLILCKDFITANGGKIWVESELGKGSIFSFSIPQSE